MVVVVVYGIVDDAVLHLCMFAAVTRRDCLFRERFKFISNAGD